MNGIGGIGKIILALDLEVSFLAHQFVRMKKNLHACVAIYTLIPLIVFS
jgi:hypothetical protein